MKKLRKFIIVLSLLSGMVFSVSAQEAFENFVSCKVDGKEFHAKAKRLRLPAAKNVQYISVVGFQVKPDIEVWIRIIYMKDKLVPGTYKVFSEEEFDKQSKKKKQKQVEDVYVFIDYTEETKNLGHGFYDGESMSGTLTVESVSATSISGTFEAELLGVHYKKRGLATVTGYGIKDNIRKKALTEAGAGILAHAHPHDHPNTKKLNETDTIIITEGRFNMDWTKEKKDDSIDN